MVPGGLEPPIFELLARRLDQLGHGTLYIQNMGFRTLYPRQGILMVPLSLCTPVDNLFFDIKATQRKNDLFYSEAVRTSQRFPS